ncbi:NAD(P)-dependent alcohol dehydrogenase [Nannocystis bainbridge]|uniref:NAD(P)-dependent alcohol dehydrogenase n=1 Tax=Nannocystis bainbridge TaxID=2995303 RepID=A0ABT5ECU2_9BACT|nr:NAD(P)-dependent alcohol dehydrogenase [Nannocystis bainbridge]MDC0723681.1 NAD(P)-dependent alcohol dehydrogenase [Nannocystis bainbridge]
MPEIRAYAAQSPTSGLAPTTIVRRDPRPDDVVIEVAYCGICHTDLSQTRDEWGGATYPMVPGHEITGIVRAVGSAVTDLPVGARVGVGCFVDGGCSRGHGDREHEHQDLDNLVLTYNGREHDGAPTYGGYAQTIVVKRAYVLEIPDALPLDAAAPLLCAGITLYSPLVHWRAGPGRKVAIVGLGGLGHLGVKLARAFGAEVTVLSRGEGKRADALALGAHDYHATSDPQTFARLAGRFDLVIITVGATLDWNAYLRLVRREGALVLVGMPDAPGEVSGFELLSQRRSLAGSGIGGIPETARMLEFCARHGITADIETVAIQDVAAAYARVDRSDVRYRFVIDMKTLSRDPGV